MWGRLGLLCALLGATATAQNWRMTPVKVIQARVQGDAPVWHGSAGGSGASCSAAESNVDYIGNDLTSKPSSSASGCCGICSATSGCNAYTWNNYNGGTCWLKSSKGNTQTTDGAVSGTLGSSASCSAAESNVDYIGNDLTSKSSASASGCCGICSATSGCKAYTWNNYNGGTCWLKTAKGGTKVTNGAVSGTLGASPTCSAAENNVDYIGNDLTSKSSASANGCCSICKATNGCKAYTWNNYLGGTCWLKTAKGGTKVTNGAISGTVSGGSSSSGAGMWLSKYGDTTEMQYINNLDTVNMASVEGALMYVQAEGINVNEQSVRCQRKNNMQYVVFYEMTIVQPAYSIKYYENHTPPEYGDFVAMDGAKCTNAGSDLPKSCKLYYGLDGVKDIGPNVGCNPQGSDPRAPYPNNYWCSFPNSCAQKYRADKSSQCRAQYNGGLCPMGVSPDGETCTYSYKILGYINIDDLVGITKMGYSNYQQFCQNGGIEFKAKNTGRGFEVEQSIDFWKNPGDQNANANRAAQMVSMYNQLASSGSSPNMTPLPSVESLTASNPKCYLNSAACARAQFGCKRSLYSQICSVCSSPGAGCEKAPAGYSFPNLSLPAGSR